jgi:hypothetical protein
LPASPLFRTPVEIFCRKHEQNKKMCSWSAVWRSVLRQCASSPRAGAMRAFILGVPPHICPRQGRRRPLLRFCAAGANGTNMRQCWSARGNTTAIDSNSPKGTTLRGSTCNCTDKAGYIYSAPLYIFRVVLLLLRQRRGAGLGELQRARGRRKYYRARPHQACFARRPKLER